MIIWNDCSLHRLNVTMQSRFCSAATRMMRWGAWLRSADGISV
ncbi:MAG: hypothetical protein Q4E41_10740 [Bacteroidales bacterium]|nr:hypothetical protein [Bacteroidales bacterium]